MEIAPGIHTVSQSKGGEVHSFILEDGDRLTVIDTLYDTDAHRIFDELARIGRTAADIKDIVITHAHRSHLGGLARLKHASGATVHAHAWEADIIAGDRASQGITFVPMRPVRAYAKVYYLQYGQALGFGHHPPCPVDESLVQDSRVGPVRVIAAPGHSPGHLAFWWPEKRTLFTGDTIVTYPILTPGWPAFTLNRKQQRDSVHTLSDIPAEVVGVGHGDPLVGDGQARIVEMVRDAERRREL
jgi:glyoxylase-like metal-dependent hydrolase (beta-lactamase superfamily II)